MTLGSLFDGSGGFPLAGQLEGMIPVWNSEIEPFAILVTRKRFPDMKHYGDVSKLNGAELEPVDVITFGSPCQDMSVAGNQTGLEGSRSGLFFEAIRIIKEMREATDGRYPRYAVWENVPGAFSSNGGADFRAVLESMCRIKDGTISIPGPDCWAPAGEILADGLSVAWRVLDAQYWGVPQRRRRIFIIADLGGQSAGKILFESGSMPGSTGPGTETGERAAGGPEKGIGKAIILNDQGGQVMSISENITATLRAEMNGHPPCVMAAGFITNHSADAHGIGYQEEISPTMTVSNAPAVLITGNGQANQSIGNVAGALNCMHDQQAVMLGDRVRRLTPTECARLQGFPDQWCRGLEDPEPTEDDLQFWMGAWKEAGRPKTEKQVRKWLADPRTDSAEYKLWGNGVALPCVRFVLGGIADYDRR